MNICGDLMQKEYFELLHTIADFDARLLLIKGWGVTFGLATLVLAFQKRSAGLFLVAALSGLSFWVLEGVLKGEQMRYYPRMRHIEVVCSHVGDPQDNAAPLIDWAWDNAKTQLSEGTIPNESQVDERRQFDPYFCRFFQVHVMFPHLITCLIGFTFAYYGFKGKLAKWGERELSQDSPPPIWEFADKPVEPAVKINRFTNIIRKARDFLQDKSEKIQLKLRRKVKTADKIDHPAKSEKVTEQEEKTNSDSEKT